MIAIFNGRERDADEWRLLFDRADSRFHFVGVKQPEGSSFAMMVAIWSASSTYIQSVNRYHHLLKNDPHNRRFA